MKRIILFFCIALLMGCSGGDDGGDDSQTPAGTTFNLYSPDRYEAGYKKTANLSGSDSQGNSWTGVLSIETQDAVDTNGQPLILIETYISLTSSATGVSTSQISSVYYDPVSLIPIWRRGGDGIWWRPTTIQLVPPIGEIGDFGHLTSWESSEGSIMTGTWRLDGAGNGLANYIVSAEVKNPDGSTLFLEEDTIRIDETGDPKWYTAKIYLSDFNVTVTLSGSVY